MIRLRAAAWLAAVLMVVAADAMACPVCHTDGGAALRAELFGARFLPDLLAVLSPFPVLLAVVAVLNGWPWDGTRGRP
jgi:hypothetical protein